jgi:heparan-alpha-glucosaminide N-acetyltransferase
VAWPQWLFVTVLVIIHTCVTFLANVPGCGKGYLGPGGLDDHGDFFNCTGGIAGYIDRQVFGEHMYRNAACKKLYEIDVYLDPEGNLKQLSVCILVHLSRFRNTWDAHFHFDRLFRCPSGPHFKHVSKCEG